MKTLMKNVLSAVAIALGVASCQVEIENPVDNNAVTHKVSIVTSEPQTKTSAAVDKVNGTVSYSWTDEDATKASERFAIYENGVAATTIVAKVIDGKMYIEAVFAGETPADPVYTGTFNSEVKSVQLGNDTNYDQESDVLYASPVTSLTDGYLVFCFSRMVAVNEVKLCDLSKGALLGDIIIENKDAEGDELTGTLNTSEMVYENGETEITLSQTASIIEGGEASAKFITVPVQNVGLKFTAVALDEDSKFVAAYEKTFADAATISFQQGKYTSFEVGMVEKTETAFDLTTNNTTTATENEISWNSTLVEILGKKGTATTDANNYVGGKGSYTSTRFYKNSTLTITPKHGVSIKKVVFEATTEGYATALSSSTWTNASAFAQEQTVVVKPTDGTAAISATIGGTTGHTSITVYYGDPKEVTHVESVSLDKTSANLVVGKNLTLTATIKPNDATNKSVNWTSSAASVATVDENGVVTAVSAGEATITATTVDGGFTAQCVVTVVDAGAGGGSQTTTLTNANIVAAGTGASSYASYTLTDENSNSYSAYAIKYQHSKTTSSYHYLQIKKSDSTTQYYIQLPKLGTKITSIKMTVSNASKPMDGGGNSVTLYFSSSSSTNADGDGVVSGTGASSVTIDASSLDLNTGYITASGAVRIWDIEITYN